MTPPARSNEGPEPLVPEEATKESENGAGKNKSSELKLNSGIGAAVREDHRCEWLAYN